VDAYCWPLEVRGWSRRGMGDEGKARWRGDAV